MHLPEPQCEASAETSHQSRQQNVGSSAESEGVLPNAPTGMRTVQHQSGAPGWNRTSDTRFRKRVEGVTSGSVRPSLCPQPCLELGGVALSAAVPWPDRHRVCRHGRNWAQHARHQSSFAGETWCPELRRSPQAKCCRFDASVARRLPHLNGRSCAFGRLAYREARGAQAASCRMSGQRPDRPLPHRPWEWARGEGKIRERQHAIDPTEPTEARGR